MKELKERLIKAKKLKFMRNVIVGVIALLIAAFIINIAPGYKRDKYKDVVNLIIDEHNVTEDLKNMLYINENKTVYMSEEDVRELFDENIYYDQQYNQIITTSYTKVANIEIEEKQMNVNDSKVNMLDAIIKINDKIYLPISDMELVYNIKIKYIEETNRVVIENLNRGLIKATVTDNASIKFKQRSLSKDVGEVVKGEQVSCYYTTSRGWRQIRTENGTVGYVKANKLDDEYIIRQDMEQKQKAKKIKIDLSQNQFNYTDENGEVKLWQTINLKSMSNDIEEMLKDYKTRTQTIDVVMNLLGGNDIKGININFDGIEDKEVCKRFAIELSPKLREIGITTCVALTKDMKTKEYENIVDYIAEK
ncbi:glycoside hydrolase family 18 [Clostridium sp. CAG:452]|nr:glycoside hydrolase family 18 [Clostridium sp. CAG:452]